MARKRMIDPNIWNDPEVGSLSFPARLLFIGLFSLADDDGRGTADPRQLRKEVFGYDDTTAAQVAEYLAEIKREIENVDIYEVDGKPYYNLNNWRKYQKISHPTPSKIPAPSGNGHAARSEWEEGIPLRKAQTLLLTAANIGALPNQPEWNGRLDAVYTAIQTHGEDKVLDLLTQARVVWCNTPRKDKKGKYSLLNPGWVDWGLAALTNPPQWENNGKNLPSDLDSALDAFVNGGEDGE